MPLLLTSLSPLQDDSQGCDNNLGRVVVGIGHVSLVTERVGEPCEQSRSGDGELCGEDREGGHEAQFKRLLSEQTQLLKEPFYYYYDGLN